MVQEIVATGRAREFRVLSRNIQLAAQSLNDIWQLELHLPIFLDTRTRPTLAEQIVIFGGWDRLEQQGNLDKGMQEDALWRATPRRVWELVMTELFNNAEELIPGSPCALQPLPRSRINGEENRISSIV